MDNFDNCTEEIILTEFKNRFPQKAKFLLFNVDYASIDEIVGTTISSVISNLSLLPIEFSAGHFTYRDLFENIKGYLQQAAEGVDRSYLDRMNIRGETYHIYSLFEDLVVAESNNLAILCFAELPHDIYT